MLFTPEELKQEGKAVTLFDLSWNVRLVEFFSALGLSVNDHESAANIDLGVTKKF